MIRDDDSTESKASREQLEILQDRICVCLDKKPLISFEKNNDEKQTSSGLVSDTIQLFKKNLTKPATPSITTPLTKDSESTSCVPNDQGSIDPNNKEADNNENLRARDTASNVESKIASRARDTSSNVESKIAFQPPMMAVQKEIAETKSSATTRAIPKSAPASLNSSRENSSSKNTNKLESTEQPPPAPSSWRKFFGLPQVADLGQKNEAYYDDKLKRWVFPGDDLTEISKPLAPPPTAVTAVANDDKKEEIKSDDALSMLMAPVGRTPRHMQQKKNSSMNSMPNVNVNVFQPKKS